MEEGERFQLSQRSALPARLALRKMAERERFELSWPDGLGTLAVCWAPRSPFPLRGPGWYGGATRERRTPSRCLQGSYAPERWWRQNGDQPWDRTTFSRTSAERYDHTSSLVDVEPTAGVEPAPAPYEGAVLPTTLRRRWSRLEDSNRDLPVIGRTSCRWTKPGPWCQRWESNPPRPA
jgi:hypothetical protein